MEQDLTKTVVMEAEETTPPSVEITDRVLTAAFWFFAGFAASAGVCAMMICGK